MVWVFFGVALLFTVYFVAKSSKSHNEQMSVINSYNRSIDGVDKKIIAGNSRQN